MSKPILYLFNGKVARVGSVALGTYEQEPDPYNPLGLPEKTIRVKFSSGYTPTTGYDWDSVTLVDAEENVWDMTRSNSLWSSVFYQNTNLLEVIGANLTGVTNLYRTFYYCTNLTKIVVFDTSSVETLSYAFSRTAITSIPLFPVDNVQYADAAFYSCRVVESGALDMYNALSNKLVEVVAHLGTFAYCGDQTVTGAAELAQIPSNWKQS